MTIVDIINKKRLKQELNQEEIDFIILKYINDEIKDYQVSAWLMAVTINGMTDKETFYLTDAMIRSGETIDLSTIKGIKVDKHSTGGVGDKTTLVLAPIVASTGVVVAKMSGRGLGHTGGTIDKLESIEGIDVSLSKEEFIKQVNDIEVAITCQTGNLVPADKKIYALRDVTATVSSIPLIASSIMSKKIASGADNIILDIKVGRGALMNNIKDATKLANLMIKIGNNYNKKVVCFLTNMNEPLGYAIGNGLEVLESIDCLKGEGPKDLQELVIKLGSYMVSLGKNISLKAATKEVTDNLINNKAYNKFVELVKKQKGNLNNITIAPKIFSIKSPKKGYIQEIDTLKLGNLARIIGAGRFQKEDVINYGVGFVLTKKIGDFVDNNDELLKVYLDDRDISIQSILSCFKIETKPVEKEPLIYKVIK